MPHSGTSIAIIGGDVGGLTAALSPVHACFGAHVYERTTVLRKVGAGIPVSPNASRVPHRLGAPPDLPASARVAYAR